jgi:hypothetical protein
MNFIRIAFISAFVSILASVAFGQGTGSIGGSVTDTLGAIVPGATVTVVAADGTQKTATTNKNGEYSVTGLTPGTYTVRAASGAKFAPYENTDVAVTAGQRTDLIVVLTVSGVSATLDVTTDVGASTDPAANSDQTVIKGKDLDALPDDPDELQSALQALAGAGAGPNGGQIYIDGFLGGQMPPKESIREIRINQNPFSAEYDRMGFGRIEILTKPGTDKFRGGFNFNFNDNKLNSRNPFAPFRAPLQSKIFGGNLSGPIQKKKSSFFLDVNQRIVDNNSIINAEILNSALAVTPFQQEVTVPTKRLTVAPRFDFQMGTKNTLVFRYSYSHNSASNQGLNSGLALPSMAFNSGSQEHEFRITDTYIINPKTVNETRLEISHSRNFQDGGTPLPIVSVSGAFTTGGAQVGNSFSSTNNFEVNNFTATSLGKAMQHSVKFGFRFRHVSLTSQAENGYGGNFSFTGFADRPGNAIDAGCDIITQQNGTIVAGSDGFISPIEQYRCKVNGQGDAAYNPTQFNITAGNPLQGVKQTEEALWASDDWKMSPAFLLSLGLRYENQTNIHSNFNFAPRLGFAWSPGAGGAKSPKTVIRGGAGIFYQRLGENSTLSALRFNGINQFSFIVNANDSNPARRAIAQSLLAQPVFTASGGVSNVPTAAQIQAVLPLSNTIDPVSSNFQAPYTIQGLVSVERQLPQRLKTTLTATFIITRGLHQIRTRDINAPVCPNFTSTTSSCIGAPRPNPALGDVFEVESSGVFNQKQLNIGYRTTISSKFSVQGSYRLSFAKGNYDGTPAYAYDLSTEYGRTNFDVRHSFNLFGNYSGPWGVSIAPFITATSGRPFNITSGFDPNADTFFAERPTFGQLAARCAQLKLTASYCNIGSHDPNAILPRDWGQGPPSFSVNLRLSKTIGFGKSPATVATTGNSGGADGGGRGNRGGGGGGGRAGGGGGGFGGFGGGGPRGGGGGFAGGETRKPYNLNFGVNVTNIFNKVNLANPVGVLNSTRFGESLSTAGGFGGFGGGGGSAGPNRRVELFMRFTF